MHLTSYYKESSNGQFRAEIHQDSKGYRIDYYAPTGAKMKSESYSDTTIRTVATIAENWVNSAQILNG